MPYKIIQNNFQKTNRNTGFDFIRSFSIFIIFIGHIINKQSSNDFILIFFRSISPGLTMSALGFISGYLLTKKYTVYDGKFYIKRFSRIYSSLFICLFSISLLHTLLSYDVYNQHSIIHFLGLSFFMELLQVPNRSSLGIGLWYITIIVSLYLILPILKSIYDHKNSKTHLFVIIICCLFLDEIMDGTASAWNVIIAFNIGSFIGNKSDFSAFSSKPKIVYLSGTLLLMIICILPIILDIPYRIRSFVYPFYPFFAVPLLYIIGKSLKGPFQQIIIWFSSISYEVYILHFYFINDQFLALFKRNVGIQYQIFIAFCIVLSFSFLFSKAANLVSSFIVNYFSRQGTTQYP